MAVNAEFLAFLASKGLTTPDIVEAVRLLESQPKQRSAAAERQARYRERQKAQNATGDVTRDVTGVTLVSPNKESPQTPKEINPHPAHEGGAHARVEILSPETAFGETGNVIPFSPEKPQKRKHPLPRDFTLTSIRLTMGLKRLQTEERVRHEFEKFCNHFWHNGKLGLNWDLALNNWFINAAEGKFGSRQPSLGSDRRGSGSFFDAAVRVAARYAERRVSGEPGERLDDPLPF